ARPGSAELDTGQPCGVVRAPHAGAGAACKPSQFDRWFGKPQRGDTLVVVNWSLKPYPLPVGANGFAACTPLGQQTVQRAEQNLASFEFFLCSNWQGPP
ncbi:MAG: hypothetical protein ACO34D_06825, partial [Burkholderiaceae bacterium]